MPYILELAPFPADQMRIWTISPRVNSPENNDPGIVTPMEEFQGDYARHLICCSLMMLVLGMIKDAIGEAGVRLSSEANHGQTKEVPTPV